jgi:ABC-type oligopeptide transport system ATPase subunit
VSEIVLEIRDLKKHFKVRGKGVVRAVDGISFSIPAGETFALVGESGERITNRGQIPFRPAS